MRLPAKHSSSRVTTSSCSDITVKVHSIPFCENIQAYINIILNNKILPQAIILKRFMDNNTNTNNNTAGDKEMEDAMNAQPTISNNNAPFNALQLTGTAFFVIFFSAYKKNDN